MQSGLISSMVFVFLLAFVVACSGSEESQMTAGDNEQEFEYVDDTNTPEIPEATREVEEPNLPQEPAVTSSGGAEDDIPKVMDLPQEKPKSEQQKTEPAPVQTRPRVTPVEVPPAPERQEMETTSTINAAVMWSVQLGAFKDEAGAMKLVDEAKMKLNQPIYKDYDPVSGFYKVTIGSFSSQEQASSYKIDVRNSGFPDAFTVEVRR